MVCLAGDALVVSVCRTVWSFDRASRVTAIAESRLAGSSADPQSELQSSFGSNRVPNDRRSGAGGGGSAIPLEVADIFFSLHGGLASSFTSTSATVVSICVSIPNGLPRPFSHDLVPPLVGGL